LGVCSGHRRSRAIDEKRQPTQYAKDDNKGGEDVAWLPAGGR